MVIFTRSASDLGSTLDADAIAQVAAMVANGWEPGTAASGWQDWIAVVAEAAADGALAACAVCGGDGKL